MDLYLDPANVIHRPPTKARRVSSADLQVNCMCSADLTRLLPGQVDLLFDKVNDNEHQSLRG